MVQCYTQDNLADHCRALSGKDKRLAKILDRHGPPPFWHREPGFPTLIRIILEQQVSLASAYAAFTKLGDLVGKVTPQAVLDLSDESLKSCGFSRQKTGYARNLASAVTQGELDLTALKKAPEHEVRSQLIKIKGIGEWTVSTYLLLSLHRLDVFPLGDLALIKSMEANGFIEKKAPKEEIAALTQTFSPFRSIFALLLWHSYIVENNVRIF